MLDLIIRVIFFISLISIVLHYLTPLIVWAKISDILDLFDCFYEFISYITLKALIFMSYMMLSHRDKESID